MTTPGQSQINQTVESISPLIINGVVKPIVDYLTSKGITITTEEICKNILLIPAKAIAAPPTTPVLMPSFLSNGNVPMATSLTSQAGGSRRGRKVAGSVSEDERCIYILTRGQHKGQLCPNPREENAPLCKQCLTKKGAAKYLNPGAQTPSGNNSGSGALPGGFLPPPVRNPHKMQAIPIKGSNNLLRTVPDGFIVEVQQDGSVVVLKIQKEENGEIRELTPEEREYAKSRGIGVLCEKNAPSIPPFPGAAPSISTSSNNQSQVPPVPDIPNIPGFQNSNTPPVPSIGNSAVPNIPQISQHIIPQMQQGPPPVPQMQPGAPPVPQIPQGPPQVPQIQQVPQMHQIPQMQGTPQMQGPPQIPQVQSMSS